MRPQWRRAWLLGPPASPHFRAKQAVFDTTLNADDHAFLYKFLTWFQAERTIPNPTILQSNAVTVSASVRMLAADQMSWPSDMELWKRVLSWIFRVHPKLPIDAFPTVIAIFAVWQNMLAGLPNGYSEHLLSLADKWLAEHEHPGPSRWTQLKSSEGELARSLRELILKSADSYPGVAERVIDRVMASERSRKEFSQVLSYSPILARACPEKLVTLVTHELYKELPAAKRERKRREQEERIAALQAIRAKPEGERTESEQRMLQFSRSSFSVDDDYSNRLRDDYSLEEHHGSFYPAASPAGQVRRASPVSRAENGIRWCLGGVQRSS